MASERVEYDTTDLDYCLGVTGFATQDGAATGFKLRVIKGLRDIVISTQIKRTDSIRHLTASGQDNHWRVQVTGAMLFQKRAAIAIRQHNIQEDQIIFPRREKGRRIFQFLCVINDMPVQSHARSDCVGKVLIVFNQKELHCISELFFLVTGLCQVGVHFHPTTDPHDGQLSNGRKK